LLEIFAALDEIDVGGVDDEEIGSFVAEKEVLVGASDFFDVVGRDVRFAVRGFFGDAGAKSFRLGLEIDDEVRRGNFAREQVVITFIEFQLFVVEIEIGEDAVFFHEEIGEKRRGRIGGKGFAEALLALEEKVHLRAKGRAGFFVVEIGEERIVFAVVHAASVETFGEDACESGFADAERAFDGNEARSLRAPLGDGCAFGRRVVRHQGGIIAARSVSGQGQIEFRPIVSRPENSTCPGVPMSRVAKRRESTRRRGQTVVRNGM